MASAVCLRRRVVARVVWTMKKTKMMKRRREE
jgi:hypothetical protein